MARMSNRVKDYESARGVGSTPMNIFDATQEVLNTMFDIRCSMKKKWGYQWYDNARYGYYDKAREELITKPACMAKSVALKCISDLEHLRAEAIRLDTEKPCIITSPNSDDAIWFTSNGAMFINKRGGTK